MAERRRRRRHSTNSGSEFSGEEEPKPSVGLSRKVGDPGQPAAAGKEKSADEVTDVSEYESANGDEDYDDDEYTDTSTEDSDDDEDDSEDDETFDEGEDVIIESEGWMDGERQSGDGEEQPENQSLDDDEDRKNPAYIPRKGAFYEHDTRLGEEAKEGGKETEARPKKKLWVDDGKWLHDRYDPGQQAPKSEQELIATYGYNILNSDRAPDAPKRRPRRQDEDSRRSHKLGDFIQDDGNQRYQGGSDYERRGGRGRGRGDKRRGMGRGDGDRGQRSYTSFKNSRNVSDSGDYADQRNNYERDRDSGRNEGQSGDYDRGQGYDRGPGYDRGRGHDRGPNYRRGPNYGQDKGQGYDRGQAYDNTRYQDRNTRRGRGGRDQYSNDRDNYNRYGGDRDGQEYNRQESDSRVGADMAPPRENIRGPPPAPSKEWVGTNYQSQDVRQQRSLTPEKERPESRVPAVISRTITDENIPMVTTPATRTTNTVSERKPYSQDRHDGHQRAPHDGERASRVQRGAASRGDRGLASAPVSQDARETHPAGMKQQSRPPGGKGNFPPPPVLPLQSGKQDAAQSRPKRYSSQRQRNLPESATEGMSVPVSSASQHQAGAMAGGGAPPPVNLRAPPPQGQQFYAPGPGQHGPLPVYPRGPNVSPRTGAPVSSARVSTRVQPPAMYQPDSPPHAASSFPVPQVMQPPMAFAIPPGVTGLPSGPLPQRLYNPTPQATSLPVATMASGAPSMMPSPYVGATVLNYGGPPPQAPPSHFQMTAPVPLQFQAPPPPPPAQVQQVQPTPIQTQQPRESGVHIRGGTTYFNPQVQQPSPSRSPIRRVKVAIPIVNPQLEEQLQHQTVVVEGTYVQEHYDYEETEGNQYTDTGAYVYTNGGQTTTILVQGKNPDQIPEFIPQQYLRLQAAQADTVSAQESYRQFGGDDSGAGLEHNEQYEHGGDAPDGGLEHNEQYEHGGDALGGGLEHNEQYEQVDDSRTAHESPTEHSQDADSQSQSVSGTDSKESSASDTKEEGFSTSQKEAVIEDRAQPPVDSADPLSPQDVLVGSSDAPSDRLAEDRLDGEDRDHLCENVQREFSEIKGQEVSETERQEVLEIETQEVPEAETQEVSETEKQEVSDIIQLDVSETERQEVPEKVPEKQEVSEVSETEIQDVSESISVESNRVEVSESCEEVSEICEDVFNAEKEDTSEGTQQAVSESGEQSTCEASDTHELAASEASTSQKSGEAEAPPSESAIVPPCQNALEQTANDIVPETGDSTALADSADSAGDSKGQDLPIQTVDLAKEIHIVDNKPEHANGKTEDETCVESATDLSGEVD